MDGPDPSRRTNTPCSVPLSSSGTSSPPDHQSCTSTGRSMPGSEQLPLFVLGGVMGMGSVGLGDARHSIGGGIGVLVVRLLRPRLPGSAREDERVGGGAAGGQSPLSGDLCALTASRRTLRRRPGHGGAARAGRGRLRVGGSATEGGPAVLDRSPGPRRLQATPYTLRHSFCSLLLHERRSVIYALAARVADLTHRFDRRGRKRPDLTSQARCKEADGAHGVGRNVPHSTARCTMLPSSVRALRRDAGPTPADRRRTTRGRRPSSSRANQRRVGQWA